MKLKMWFCFLRIKKTFRKFYNLTIFIKLRKSFAYTFLKMFALILAVLWLQFLILPHHGYINTPQPLSVANTEISAGGMKFVANKGSFTVYDFDRLHVRIDNVRFSIDDIECPDRDIMIDVTSQGEKPHFNITFSTGTYILFSSYDGALQYYERSYYSLLYPCIHNLGYTTFHANDLDISFTNCDVGLFSIDSAGNKIAPIVNDIASLRVIWGIGNITIGGGKYDIQFEDLFYDYIPEGEGNLRERITFYYVDDISCEATGEVIFSDSPDKKEYDIQNQNISLIFEPDKCSATLLRTKDDTQLTVNGLVYAANVGGYDLFPSFRNWYYNNLYIAPLTLLSVVISSVAIILKKRNKE